MGKQKGKHCMKDEKLAATRGKVDGEDREREWKRRKKMR